MPDTVSQAASAPQPGLTKQKSSTAKKLVQAAALAAVLVPLGSIAVESSSITCSYSGSGGSTFCSPGGSGISSSGNLFTFGSGSGYSLKLAFDQVNGFFDVTVTDFPTTQSALLGSGRLSNTPGYVCVPILDASNTCVEFLIDVPDASPTTWDDSGTNGYFLYIQWFANTDPAFSNLPGNRIQILKRSGTAYDPNGPAFATITSGTGAYTVGNGIPDPGIGGFGKSFSGIAFTVTQAPVPEPASLLLVGTGVSALLYRRRRRKGRDT